MTLATALNAVGLTRGFVGAGTIWVVSRKEGPGLPFYADSEGKILSEVAAENRKRDSRKNIGMALIAISFVCQLIALYL